MSFDWRITKSPVDSQKSERSSAVQSSESGLTRKLAQFLRVKFPYTKYLGTNSGPDQVLLSNHAGSSPLAGTPYTGTAISLPGGIEAENFDNGGEAVAYHDTTSTNDGGYYRNEGVDICTCGSPYGLSVGWTQPGEWMEYTVNVATYGTYKFQTLTATVVSSTALHIEVDGVNVTGQMNLPNTGAWHLYGATSSAPVTLTAGQHIIRIAVDVTGFLIDSVDVIRLNTPYGGTAAQLPGTIPAENFDNGGEGVAYHDTTPTNDGGAYRSEAVDLCFCGFAEGAALGWSYAGEWSRYTVNFNTTDTYTLQAKISTLSSGNVIHLEVDGVNVTGTMVLPNTGSWDTWATISKPNVQIAAGQHEIRMVIESGGFLLDSLSAIPSLPSAPSVLTANAISSSQINLNWSDNSFNETGFKLERKSGSSGSYSEITTTAAGATSFSDSGLQPGMQYFYRVRATNLGGNSAYSNESSATTTNLPPSVTITSPSAGTVFNALANISIDASASDSDGVVSKVEFFQGSTKLGEDLSEPYSFSWTNVAAGTYSLTAKATDNLGGITTSASLAITVNALPTISITAPVANAVFHSPANLTITASASDSDGSVGKVEFFQNGTLLGEDTTAPYSYVWNNAPVGSFSLTARATDNRNATATSSALTIVVNNPPSVSISAPTANSTFVAGAAVTIAALTSDADGTISKVEFYQGTTKLGEDVTSPFAIDWSNVPQGSYSLLAIATDDRGALTTSTAVSINVVITAVPRLDPMNETGGGGENPLSRNFNWNLPLLSLPGRAGMDLGLTLSYNSLVWTRINSNSISFDDDRGFPSPGFRLGFPVIQQKYFNAEVGKNAYMLIGIDGSRTELRQVDTDLYEAADSSHLLLDDRTMILRTTDGTQLSYAPHGGEFHCTQIKDRNGNYITVSYTPEGRINTVTDTLNRVITFNYINGLLDKITQVWNDNLPNEVTHNWARFEYADKTIDTNFQGFTVHGPADLSTIKTLTKVRLADNSCYEFAYTSWGQAWKVTRLATDGSVLNYRTYDLPQTGTLAHDDCPRFTVRKDWAKYWNGDIDGTTAANEEVATATFIVPVSDNWTMPDNTAASGVRAQVTAADGTLNKIYFVGIAGTDSGWKRGLPALVETHSGGQWKRKVMTTWTQDDDTSPFILNPRVLETNVYDPEGNRARTEIDYGDPFDLGNGMSCRLPRVVFEYAANATTKLRSTRTTYNMSDPYKDRRILGLVSVKELFEGDVNGALKSKVSFFYDNDNGSSSIQGTDAPVQHDNDDYTASFVTGRANLSSVKRHNVDNLAESTTTRTKYNTAGAVVSMKDALNHETTISYADSFSDGILRNTLAYPTKIIDPDTFETTTKYNFDFGAVTSKRTPKPNETANVPEAQRPEQIFTFDTIGRPQQITNSVNNASTRFEYPNTNRVDTFTTIEQGQGEAQSVEITDGAGRVVASATAHPGSVGGFSGQKIVYDLMGRVFRTSNPTETNTSGAPSQWVAAGDDAAAGWLYTEQTYDWKGRPLVTINPDGTTKTASYSGCGCAGGEVVTLTDEGTIDAGVAKHRQQKLYTDVLGRTVKAELLNWAGGTVYSANVTTYNVRDQVEDIKQYAGTATVGNPFQQTTQSYDGYGRLQTKHLPQEAIGTATTWTYNADDTVNTITDARGTVSTFGYADTNRKLVKSVIHVLAGKPTINVTFSYDAVGNRISMSDPSGTATYTYNQLSQLSAESKTLGGTSYTLNYEYNLGGQLKKMTYPGNISINYGYDAVGRLTGVTGSDTLYQGITQYASAFTYRAWGARKTMTDGASRTSTVTYDTRLRPASFEISGDVVNQSYEYYNDGRMKFVHNHSDNKFDRAYSYDHADRLTLATTGGAARGDSGDVPYFETFGYNAWGDTTSRMTETWATHVFADVGTYANRRRNDWDYEPNGQIKTIDTRTYSYDAAGNRVLMTGHIWSGSNYFPTSTTSGYDGDGRRVEEISTFVTTLTSRYLRSTVLGGEIVQETNSAGQTIRYVYLPDGTHLSTLIGFGKWKHETPGGTGLYETFQQDGFVNRVEFDPMRANVGLTAPPPPDTNGGDGDIGSNHNGGPADSRFSNMANPAAGCYEVNGVVLPCTWSSFDVMWAFVWGPARNPAVSIPSDTPRVWVPAKKTMSIVLPPTPFDQFLDNPIFNTNEPKGYWKYAPAPFTNITFAQNTGSPLPARNLLPEVFRLLDNNRCFTFISNLLNVARQLTGRRPYSYDAYELAVTIATQQPQGGVYFLEGGDGGGSAGGDIFSGTARAAINLRRDGPGMSSVGVQVYYALVALHEFIHVAGGVDQNGIPVYSDYRLALAAKIYTGAPGYPSGPAPRNREEQAKLRDEVDDYWDNQLWEHCNPGGPKR